MLVHQHAKVRSRERLGIRGTNSQQQNFKLAYSNGLGPDSFTGKFRQYLYSHLYRQSRDMKYKYIPKNNSIKVYKEHVYVFHHKNPITVFPVPEKYIPTSQFRVEEPEHSDKIQYLTSIVGNDIQLDLLSDKSDDNPIMVVGLLIKDEFKCYGMGNTLKEAETNAIDLYINTLNSYDKDVKGGVLLSKVKDYLPLYHKWEELRSTEQEDIELFQYLINQKDFKPNDKELATINRLLKDEKIKYEES